MTDLFIAGGHTDVGKTHVACALLRAARARGLAADAFKPVVSGFDPAGWAASDPGRLLAALDRLATAAALAAISPWRFAAPLAPPMAAACEGRDLPLTPIVDATRAWLAAPTGGLRVVEGVGGLMSPLADSATGLDLMQALGLPTVLVGGSYLGAISHTLTALEVMRARGLPVAALVVSQSADPGAPDFAATVRSVAEHAGDTPVLAAPRGADTGWADALLDSFRPAGRLASPHATSSRLAGPRRGPYVGSLKERPCRSFPSKACRKPTPGASRR